MKTPQPSKTLTTGVLLAMLVAVPLASIPTASAYHATTPNTLPLTLCCTSSVFANGYAYIFGGYGCSMFPYDCAEVRQYNPATGAVSTVAGLDEYLHYTSAVYDGSRYAYIFGGSNCWSGCKAASSQIYRYDTVGNQVVDLSVNLPSVRSMTAAAWINGKAYIFGGVDAAGNRLGDILQFTPSGTAGTVVTKAARLHQNAYGVAATATSSGPGGVAWLYGGNGQLAGGPTTLVQKYDPFSDTLTPFLANPLPTALAFSTAAWADDGASYIMGGGTSGSPTNQIWRHAPGSTPSLYTYSSLPVAMETHSVATDNRIATPAFLLFGGRTNQIVRIAPTNLVPSVSMGGTNYDSFECNASGGGNLPFSATVTDPDPGDRHTYEWAGTGTFADPSAASTTGFFEIGSDHWARATAHDWEGHAGSASRVISVVDTRGPTTEAQLSGEGGPEWFSGPVTVDLSASDVCSPVSTTRYSVNYGPWTQGNSVTVTSEGWHLVRFYSVDSRGNVEVDTYVNFGIDADVLIEWADPEPGHVYVLDTDLGPVTPGVTTVVGAKSLRAEVLVGQSSVSYVQFRRDNQLLFTDFEAPYEFAWTPRIGDAGQHTLRATAYNYLGESFSDEQGVAVVPLAV